MSATAASSIRRIREEYSVPLQSTWINPSLYDNAENEFKRLKTYFYVPSDSSIASCLVTAPKATAPFIRLFGDYVTINRYISNGHYYTPNVQQCL